MNGSSAAPTKGNLLRLREELQLATEAYELLDRKREVLVNELMALMQDLRNLQESFHRSYRKALLKLRTARVRMGEERMKIALAFESQPMDLEAFHRSVMGVHVIELAAHPLPPHPLAGPQESAPELEEAQSIMRDILEVVLRYVSQTAAAWRLATEVQKTQRRVTALENIFLPGYSRSIARIQSALEENDREQFFRLKRLKGKSAAAAFKT